MKKINKITSKRKFTLSETAISYLYLLPFLGLFFLFILLPVFVSFILSFFDFDMVSTPIFTGVDNYRRMFVKDSTFSTVLGNTLKFAVVTGPVGYMLAFVLAWLINEFHPIVRNILSFLFYAPALVGNVYYIWTIAFSGDSFGYVNNLLISFGFITEPIQWFKNTDYNMIIIMIVQLWMSMGVSFLANIAGLQNVNTELYEAGAIDGIKTRWHELWYITLPSMGNILLFSAVMQIQSVFSISAVVTNLAGYPSVNNSVDTIVSYIHDVGTMRYEMGYAAALSFFLFLLMAITRVVIGSLLNLIGKSSD